MDSASLTTSGRGTAKSKTENGEVRQAPVLEGCSTRPESEGDLDRTGLSACVPYSFPHGSGGKVVRVLVGCTFLAFLSFLVAFFDAMVFLLLSNCALGRSRPYRQIRGQMSRENGT